MTDWAAESERRAVAYHESGHAVVAVVLGLPLWFVTIAPDDARSCRGEARLAPNWQKQTDETKLAIFSLAGAAAERRAQGREIPGGAAKDLENVRHIVALKSDNPREQHQFFDAYLRLAETKVLLHWPWIEAVARELLKTTQLVATRVRALEPK
jgi:hypothetical protein